MAFEAVLKQRLADPIDFIVADGTGIERGAALALTDPRTAAAVLAANDLFAGIAAREKVASDGRTRLALFRDGIFDMKASGAITVGSPVKLSSTANHVAAVTQLSGANIVGIALETAADAEVIEVDIRPMSLSGALELT